MQLYIATIPNHSDIQIKIFDNQITIFSPGKLYGGLTVTELLTDSYQSRTRNKLVAEAFYLTNNIEKYGSGFVRIRKELLAYPEISLEVEEIGDGVLLLFIKSEVVNGGVSGGVNGGVNGTLHQITSSPGIRTDELLAKLSCSKRTLERWLKQLRDEGKIVYKGAPKTGGYHIAEKV